VGDPNAKVPPNAGPQRAAKVRQALERIEVYERELTRIVLDGYGKLLGLRYIPGLTIFGPREVPKIGRDPTFAFKLDGYEDHDLAKILWDKYALAVGSEDYYSRVPALYKAKTMMRATFVHYNTKQEVLALLEALSELAAKKK
jgi:selenocysteine lyase/cysteine desulfurase